MLNKWPDTTTRLCYDDYGDKVVDQYTLVLPTVGLGKNNVRVSIDVQSVLLRSNALPTLERMEYRGVLDVVVELRDKLFVLSITTNDIAIFDHIVGLSTF